jgi:hypothetical protein
MPSEDEIKFAQSRFKIQDAVCTCFATAEMLLPLHLREGGAHVDSVVGQMQSGTLSGQQLVQFRTYTSATTPEPQKIEVAIGHTGTNWTPIVTVTSTSTEPEQVLFDGEFNDALRKILRMMTERIKILV